MAATLESLKSDNLTQKPSITSKQQDDHDEIISYCEDSVSCESNNTSKSSTSSDSCISSRLQRTHMATTLSPTTSLQHTSTISKAAIGAAEASVPSPSPTVATIDIGSPQDTVLSATTAREKSDRKTTPVAPAGNDIPDRAPFVKRQQPKRAKMRYVNTKRVEMAEAASDVLNPVEQLKRPKSKRDILKPLPLPEHLLLSDVGKRHEVGPLFIASNRSFSNRLPSITSIASTTSHQKLVSGATTKNRSKSQKPPSSSRRSNAGSRSRVAVSSRMETNSCSPSDLNNPFSNPATYLACEGSVYQTAAFGGQQDPILSSQPEISFPLGDFHMAMDPDNTIPLSLSMNMALEPPHSAVSLVSPDEGTPAFTFVHSSNNTGQSINESYNHNYYHRMSEDVAELDDDLMHLTVPIPPTIAAVNKSIGNQPFRQDLAHYSNSARGAGIMLAPLQIDINMSTAMPMPPFSGFEAEAADVGSNSRLTSPYFVRRGSNYSCDQRGSDSSPINMPFNNGYSGPHSWELFKMDMLIDVDEAKGVDADFLQDRDPFLGYTRRQHPTSFPSMAVAAHTIMKDGSRISSAAVPVDLEVDMATAMARTYHGCDLPVSELPPSYEADSELGELLQECFAEEMSSGSSSSHDLLT